MPGIVRITDVAPRDGLQNEAGTVSSADKARLIDLLAETGVDEVEVTSFVSPKWVPQLGDASEVCREIAPQKPKGVVYSALVPNEKGMEALLAANAEALEAAGRRVIDKASVFTAASETFSRRNTNATIAETLERFAPVLSMARAEGLSVRGYVSCAIACPFEGPIDPARVADVAARLAGMGVDEIDLGDTIGAGDPATVQAVLEAVGAAVERAVPLLTLHLHDTFGRAGACVRTALEFGVRSFDGAAGGLGGCPYAATGGRRAPGNISTELLVRTVREAGFETRVDGGRLADASRLAGELAARARTEAPA